MPRKGQSEERIVYALRQVEGGQKVSEVCRELGVSTRTFYSWKRRYAGLGVERVTRAAYPLSANRACGLVKMTRWSNRYPSRRDPQNALRLGLKELAGARTR